MNVRSVSYRSVDAPKQFTDSLRETGFGVLTDHPIPFTLVTDVFNDWKQFFNSNAKHQYAFHPELQAGYFPFRTENAKGAAAKDLKEFFHLYPWNALPKGMPGSTRELFHRMSELAGELLGVVPVHERGFPGPDRVGFDKIFSTIYVSVSNFREMHERIDGFLVSCCDASCSARIFEKAVFRSHTRVIQARRDAVCFCDLAVSIL
jgi:hypothetical protein